MPEASSAISDFGPSPSLLVRRLRHITSIQVRNLTPFPVRDAFTSALFHQSEAPNSINSVVTYSDDLNVPPIRRRTRKISANSIGTTRSSLKWEDGLPEEDLSTPTATIRGRKTSGSTRVNFASSGGVGASGSGISPSSPRSTFSKFQRPRTNSKASSTSSRYRTSFFGASTTTSSTSSFLPDHTQKGLEKVIHARLLETCLVISVTEHAPELLSLGLYTPASAASPSRAFKEVDDRQPPKSAPPSRIRTPLPPSRQNSTSSTNDSHGGRNSTPLDRYPSPNLESHEIAPAADGKRLAHRLQPSINGKPKVFPSPPLKPRPKPDQLVDTASLQNSIQPRATLLTYRSPIHRPSTNPTFSLDDGMLSQGLEWTRLNAQVLRVAIWGKLPQDVQLAGWDDDKPPPYPEEEGYRWRVIQEWDVHLDDLIPLPEETKLSSLPSNTCLLTLDPHGTTYYLPHTARITSRASSPSGGYASDPESELHRLNRSQDKSNISGEFQVSRRRRRGHNISDSKGEAKTAPWPDLFQLATLQALIYDNENSLSAISAKVDRIIAEDQISPLRREISERQNRISELHLHHHQVFESCSQKREQIRERIELLKQRRDNLSLAHHSISDNEVAEAEIAKVVDEQRAQLMSLRSTMASVRSSLIAMLAEIFPIELYSPPDLLFTIFDVALPLPLSATDPAPPLSVPEHKEINEDSVATALGYVAQVLQLLAAYLGTNLLYPVTCIGSRSLVRDGISAMIGPRMFPLYSKGVDTYRFEYAVFLLNKNIELLMVEKDLRALDMRHTLPNLKNLLLILSHEGARTLELSRPRALGPSSSTLSLLSLNSEVNGQNGRGVSPGTEPQSDSSATPKTSGGTDRDHQVGTSRTPPQSGATTPIPTAASEDSRTSRFLALAPFTGFLRGRYPSTSRASAQSNQVDAAEPVEDDADEEDGDRSTIHGLVRDVDKDEQKNQERNGGDCAKDSEGGERKAHGDPPNNISVGTTLAT